MSKKGRIKQKEIEKVHYLTTNHLVNHHLSHPPLLSIKYFTIPPFIILIYSSGLMHKLSEDKEFLIDIV
jgi:hypothetical protein